MDDPILDTHALCRRHLLLTGIAGGSILITPHLQAQSVYPDHPLRLLVPFPAGGPTDIVARPLALLLSEHLGQQVVIDNRGGAGGAIGADLVAKSPADGYTLLMGTVGTQAINPALYRKLAYDPNKDFAALGLVASAPIALVAHPGARLASMADFIAAARREPGRLTFGSAGNGTPGHLAGVLFAKAAGITLNHVPYRGSAPAVTDLLGNQIDAMFDPLQSVLGHVQGGKLRALALSADKRSPLLPQLPTMAESGLPEMVAEAWWAVYAPAALPTPIAQRLTQAIDQVARSDNFKERLGNLGLRPTPLSGSAFDDFARTEYARWGKAVRDSGAALD